MVPVDDNTIQRIPSEEEDQDTVPVNYDIVTYPADFTLEVIISKFGKTILVPGFQRKYVWNIKQASRLIESFLLGLPVPAIFLYVEPKDNSYIVVDGQQRLMSVAYFFEGYFGEPDAKGKRTTFSLQGLNERSPFNGLTCQDLKQHNEAAYNRLQESILRAFIIKQLRPEGRSSVYHVFERLNTGGTQLVGQEIRNCIYHGEFNDLLIALNKGKDWRAIFGKPIEDRRQRDIELILRFFALYHNGANYSKPMKDFLSNYMASLQDDGTKIAAHKRLFRDTAKTVFQHLGEKPFHIYSGLNVAAFDGVFVAFARNRNNIPKDVAKRYKSLQQNRSFLELVGSATTDEEVIANRLELVEQMLFG